MAAAISPVDPVILQLRATIGEAIATAHLWHAEEHRLICGARDQYLTAHIKILEEENRREVSGAALALDLLVLGLMCFAPGATIAVSGATKGLIAGLKRWSSARLTQMHAMRLLVMDDGQKTLRIAMRVITSGKLKPITDWTKWEPALKTVRAMNKDFLPLAFGQTQQTTAEFLKYVQQSINQLQYQVKASTREPEKGEVKTVMGTYPSVRLVDHLLRESNWQLQATLNTLGRAEHEVLAGAYSGTLNKKHIVDFEKSVRENAVGMPSLSPDGEAAIVRFIEFAMWAVSYPFGIKTRFVPGGRADPRPREQKLVLNVVSKAGWSYLLDRFPDPATGAPFSAARPTHNPRDESETPKGRFSVLAGTVATELLKGSEELYADLVAKAVWGQASPIREPEQPSAASK